MRHFIAIAIAFLLASMGVYAQKPSLRLDADAAVFRYDENHRVWEWYYAFPDTAITYVERDGHYVGEVYCRVTISTPSATVADQEWIISNASETMPTTHQQNLIGVKSFVLEPGEYSVECMAIDMAQKEDTLRRKFAIALSSPVTDRLAISDIELASRIDEAQDESASSYRKGSILVVPNPSLLYVAESDNFEQMGGVLPYYVELYNVQQFAPAGVNLRYAIIDAAQQEVVVFQKRRASIADAFADYGVIPLDTLPSGVYFLQARVSSVESTETASAVTQKKFYVLNPDKPPALQVATESQEFEMSAFASMADERVEEEYQMVEALLSVPAKETFLALTDIKAKQKFLFRFWKNRDFDPRTPENEALEEFRSLVEYANRYFSTLYKKGWKTDRGRVLLQYGKPDKEDVKLVDTEAKSHTIWYYYRIQGGVEFCFVDLNSTDEFTLVHSTAQNEIREPRWYERYAQILGAATFSR